jgi:hypothetical protein
VLFSPEDRDSMLLRNVGIYRRVYTAPKPRITSSSSPPWKTQISQVLFSSEFWYFLTHIKYSLRIGRKLRCVLNFSFVTGSYSWRKNPFTSLSTDPLVSLFVSQHSCPGKVSCTWHGAGWPCHRQLHVYLTDTTSSRTATICNKLKDAVF